jgi:AraC-like DNA-binding protein
MTANGKNVIAGSGSPRLTVSAGLAVGLVRLAVSKGADEALLLARAGIAEKDLKDHDKRIAFPKYVALMRHGKVLSGDPALALHYGESNDLAEVSVVGLLAYACETMAEATKQLNRYGRLVVEFDGPSERFSFTRDSRGLWLVDNRGNSNDFPELTESTFARAICGPRRFGVVNGAKAIEVTHSAPDYCDEYLRVLGVPVTFEAPRNAILLNESVLTQKVAVQPRYAFGIFAEHADTLLENLRNSKTMRGLVEGSLVAVLHSGDANIETVAEKLGVSRSTLFNRLQEEGTSFTKVLDELRHRMAIEYLRGRKVSVNETAYLVGFSEPAAFSRAFKRWTGQSPKRFRLQLAE